MCSTTSRWCVWVHGFNWMCQLENGDGFMHSLYLSVSHSFKYYYGMCNSAVRVCVRLCVHLYVICNVCDVVQWYFPFLDGASVGMLFVFIVVVFIQASIIWFIISSISHVGIAHRTSALFRIPYLVMYCTQNAIVYPWIQCETMPTVAKS